MHKRLSTEFWIAAYRKRLELENIPAFIVSKGDATSGAICIKLSTLDGKALLFERRYLPNGAEVWEETQNGAEDNIDAYLHKQKQFDQDLWVVEVEERQGRHLLDEMT